MQIFYLKLQNCITFLQQWTIYGLNALTRDHVNNFLDTSTPIYQAKSLVGTYTYKNLVKSKTERPTSGCNGNHFRPHTLYIFNNKIKSKPHKN